jgi:hypothetical protein
MPQSRKILPYYQVEAVDTADRIAKIHDLEIEMYGVHYADAQAKKNLWKSAGVAGLVPGQLMET